MRRPSYILVMAALAAVALAWGAYQVTQVVCRACVSQQDDELAWLRTEFKLDAAQLSRVRELHDGYLPRCQEFCARIEAGQRELDEILATEGADSPRIEEKLTGIGTLRAQCQAAMLRHFAEVSREMPADQGRRYLAEMQRLTIGAHERTEAAMSSDGHEGHNHGE